MIKQTATIDVQDPWPDDIAKELRQIWNDARNCGAGSNKSYVVFNEDMWDDYEHLPMYLAREGHIPEDEILVLIHW